MNQSKTPSPDNVNSFSALSSPIGTVQNAVVKTKAKVNNNCHSSYQHRCWSVGTGNRCPHGGPPEMRGPPEVGSPQENGRYCKFRHPVCVHPLLQISPGQYVCSKYMAFCNNTHHELIYRELREYGSSQMVPTNVGYPKPTRRYKSEMPPRSRTNYRSPGKGRQQWHSRRIPQVQLLDFFPRPNNVQLVNTSQHRYTQSSRPQHGSGSRQWQR